MILKSLPHESRPQRRGVDLLLDLLCILRLELPKILLTVPLFINIVLMLCPRAVITHEHGLGKDGDMGIYVLFSIVLFNLVRHCDLD